MERLRDRTDELELIISSLTLFALYSIPSWLLEVFASNYTHISTTLAIAGTLVGVVMSGSCYGLATCFVIHLMVRAYWVGLIGLRAAFPEGIRWDRTPTLGPMGRDALQRSLPAIDDLIAGADRIASSLFAFISMLTLVSLWLGTFMVGILVVAGGIGSQFGVTNATLGVVSILLFVMFLGFPALVFLLDGLLAARFPALRHSVLFTGLVKLLRRVASLAFPERLIMPVQLTLQSNTRPITFVLILSLSVGFIFVAGNLRYQSWADFTLSDEFLYLDDEDTRGGFRSVYYEDMQSPKDRLRASPRLTSFEQSGSYLRVFLPYQPLRDNLVIKQTCDTEDTDSPPGECLRQLWSMTLAGREISMAGFLPAERFDLGMRGLLGVVSLEGLAPGLHTLEVAWGASGLAEVNGLDDRYEFTSLSYNVPFLFTPGVERSLDAQ